MNRRTFATLAMALAAGVAAPAAPTSAPPAAPTTKPDNTLIVRTQDRVKQEFETLTRLMLEAADRLAKGDAESVEAARTIRQAVQEAQREFIADNMAKVIELLSKGLVHPANATQGDVIEKLKAMLEILRSGTIELDKRWQQIEQWRTYLEGVDRILEREKELANRSLIASDGAAMADRLGELAQQLEQIVKQQKELLANTEKLPEADALVARLAAVRGMLIGVRDRQDGLAKATGRMDIDQLPGAEKLQKDLLGQLTEAGGKLDEIRADASAKAALEKAGVAALADKAAADVVRGGAEMERAAGELAGSNKTTSAERQRQASADVTAAIDTLAQVLAKLTEGTQAGALAGKQGALSGNTSQLAKSVKEAMAAATGQGQPGQGDAATQPGESTTQPGQATTQPGQPGQQAQGNLDQAAEDMAQAAGALAAQDKQDAAAAQREAIKKMENDLVELGELKRRLEERAANPDLDDQQNDQDETQKKTDELAGEMQKQNDPNGSPTPGQESVSAASKSMGQASKSLSQSQAGQANQEQRQAVEELQRAREELARAIAEQEQLAQGDALVRIEAMLRVIHRSQVSINARTAGVYEKRRADDYDRPEQLELAELSNTQGRQTDEIRKIVEMIRQEGTTAVFPSVLEQVAEDMANVQELLSKRQAGPLTQSVQDQIVRTLKELIEALQQEMQRREQEPQQPDASQGQGQRPPLVPPVAELKMLRTLQQQVNERTLVIDAQVRQGEADQAVSRLQHKLLSDREARVAQLTRDLAWRMQRGQPPTVGPGGRQ